MNSAQATACRCCLNSTSPVVSGQIIGINVQYHECQNCGFVQTDDPHWLDLAYSDAINDSDTGLVRRNLINARYVVATLRALNNPTGKVVDFAGGYGLLVRLLRDSGVDAWWSDPFCDNLLCKGFESSEDHANKPTALVTAFEAFEHFANPRKELELMLQSSRNVFLSTVLMPQPTPAHDDWWYYGREHGQHVAFYRLATFEAMAKRHNLHFLSNGRNYHLFTDKYINRQRWLFWMKMGKANVPWLYKGLESLTESDHQYHSLATSRTT